MFHLRAFLILIYKKPNLPSLILLFSHFFLVFKLYVSVISVNYTSYFGHIRSLENLYIWGFLINSESVLLASSFKYTLSTLHLFGAFWRLFVLSRKIVQNLIFVYLFCPKNRRIDSKKPRPLVEAHFNTLLIGLQYTLSWNSTTFDTKAFNMDLFLF